MKILFVTNSMGLGGAQWQIVMMADGLKAQGHDARVVIFNRGRELDGTLGARGIELLDLGRRNRWNFIGNVLGLVRLVRAQRPDVVYAIMPSANIQCVCARPFWGDAKIIWGVRVANADWRHYSVLDVIYARLQVLLASFPDMIVSNSEAGWQELISDGVRAGHVVTIPNIMCTDHFKRDEAARSRVRAEWGVGTDEFLVANVARFDLQKDHPTYFRAAVRALESNAKLRFVCVGGGPPDLTESYRKLVRELGFAERMIWTGARLDMPDVYSALDLICVSSLFEGFSNVTAEAMACEARVVSTDVGDARRVVGDTGWIVDIGDAEAMASAIVEAARREGRPSPRERIEKMFSFGPVISELEAVLDAVTGAGRPMRLPQPLI